MTKNVLPLLQLSKDCCIWMCAIIKLTDSIAKQQYCFTSVYCKYDSTVTENIILYILNFDKILKNIYMLLSNILVSPHPILSGNTSGGM